MRTFVGRAGLLHGHGPGNTGWDGMSGAGTENSNIMD